jgi:photoactive yellow protein
MHSTVVTSHLQPATERPAASLFAAPDALEVLERCTALELDELDFGVVAMAADGTVLAYNRREGEMAHRTPSAVIGKHFFEAVAPCTNNALIAKRFASETMLDATIDYTFAFRLRPIRVKLRLLRSLAATRMYLLVDWRG